MVKGESDAVFSGYKTMRSESNYNKSLKSAVAAVITLAAVVGIACVTLNGNSDSFTMLEEAPASDLEYGQYITLKNVYNQYILVGHSGRAYTGGYHADFDRIQVLSASAAQGPVNFGDVVTLVGQNDKYFVTRDSGRVTCRQSTVIPGAKFTILGGTGPVKVGDTIHFKTIFGFMTATNNGIKGDTETLTSMETYQVGKPGEENGLHSHLALTYGQGINLRNRFDEFLQTGPNGWVFIRSDNGRWNHFDVLSPVHRQGPVRYGDEVILRGHNHNMVMARDGGLTAYKTGRTAYTVFTLIGGEGVIRNGDMVALKAPSGFVNGEMAGERADIDLSGHYNPTQNFQVVIAP